MAVPTTTIKVPKALHERLSERARREQVTLATAIEHALDEADERSFWLAVRAEHASMGNDERAEYETNAAFGDDLDDPSDDELTAGHGW